MSVCLRFTPRESDGSYREPRERAILYVDGRLDRIIDNASEPCAGAVYAPFPRIGTDDAVAARFGERILNRLRSLFGEP